MESVAHHSNRQFGKITVSNSRLYWVLSLLPIAFAISICALFIFGEFTRRANLQGYLVPIAGIIHVSSQVSGEITQLHVVEGQIVHVGDKLLTLGDLRVLSRGVDARSAALTKINGRKQNIVDVISQKHIIFVKSKERIKERLTSLTNEINQLSEENSTTLILLHHLETTAARYKSLASAKIVSDTEAQERENSVLEMHARSQGIERGQTSLRRELSGLQVDLIELPMREHLELAELERSFLSLEQEEIESDAKREIVVTAPQSGKVDAISVQVGYTATPGKSLLTIVPTSGEAMSPLEVQLFAQSKDIGFVKRGQNVLIRINAFPYQKFGHFKGVIDEVSRTPLSSANLLYPIGPKLDVGSFIPANPLSAIGSTSEPLFRIKVRLEHQFASPYGKTQDLQPGMQLEADVMLDRRTLLEWMFEPLYGLKGKYF